MKSGNHVFELDRRDRAARAALIVVLVSVHLLLIVWLASQRMPASSNGKSLAVVGLLPGLDPGRPAKASARASEATPQERHPIIELPPLPSLDLAAMVADSAEAASTGVGSGCALTEQLRTAILADPASMAELASLPAGVRSDADAVMLWNGEWFDPGPQPDPSVPAPMRALIEKLIAAAPAECRSMTWTGPQFIPIAEGRRFTMLVVGSGAWRWQDLIEPPAHCAVGEFAACAPESARMGMQSTN